uniref:Uncharacterized protein n=1 Tax=Lepeophtheirus salmonis TaxID=72036 RepID=A0A0K2TKU5_LEPSM
MKGRGPKTRAWTYDPLLQEIVEFFLDCTIALRTKTKGVCMVWAACGTDVVSHRMFERSQRRVLLGEGRDFLNYVGKAAERFD